MMLLEAEPVSAMQEQALEILMRRYQGADPVAAAELIHLLSPRLYRYLAGLPSTRTHAEDLVQECWLRIHKSRHTYRPGAPVLPWVFAIARHTRVDGYRRQRRIESHEMAVEQFEDLPEHAAKASNDPDLSRFLDELPESQREVILMLKVSGMSLEEVARATSTTVGAVKQKAHRAYATLRARFGEIAKIRPRHDLSAD